MHNIFEDRTIAPRYLSEARSLLTRAFPPVSRSYWREGAIRPLEGFRAAGLKSRRARFQIGVDSKIAYNIMSPRINPCLE